jgi:hypothetical protein
VYGIDILDASIPNTMFNIDTDNNALSYILGHQYKAPEVENMEHTLNELTKLDGFNDILNFMMTNGQLKTSGTYNPFNVFVMEGETTTDDLLLDPAALRKYTTPELDMSQFIVDDNSFDHYLSTLTNASQTNLVFRKHRMPQVTLYPTCAGLKSPFYEVKVGDVTFYTQDTYFADFYLLFEKKYGEMTFYDHLYRRGCPPDVVRSYYLERTSCESNVFNWYYYTATPYTQIGFDDIVANAGYLSLHVTTFEPGNYSATNLMEAATLNMDAGLVMDTSRIDSIMRFPYMKFNSDLPFIMNMKGSSINSIIGMGENATNEFADFYTPISNCSGNDQLFGALANPSSSMSAFSLKAPGVINLDASRYIVLRCEELEDHLFGSYSYGDFNPGIALLRFFETNGINHQRVDYVNFTKSPFHPIGKLGKMTLTFLLPDLKTRYDFKGCNHFLILSIKYYVPIQKKRIERSVLNPNYDPNFRQYFQQYIDYKESMDDREEDTSHIDPRKVSEVAQQYDYSSSSSSSCASSSADENEDLIDDHDDDDDDGVSISTESSEFILNDT